MSDEKENGLIADFGFLIASGNSPKMFDLVKKSFNQVSSTGFERDFGLKVVLNTVDPKKIKSVDSKLVDTVTLNKRMQSSKENSIEDFGIDINKDLLRSVIGKPSNNSFGSMVAGSDTLTINCDVKSSTLFQKCSEIAKEYTSIVYKKMDPRVKVHGR